jgi:hypothetical protein
MRNTAPAAMRNVAKNSTTPGVTNTGSTSIGRNEFFRENQCLWHLVAPSARAHAGQLR